MVTKTAEGQMNIVDFPGQAPIPADVTERVTYFRKVLEEEGVNPDQIRSHAELDAILARIEAEADAVLAKLPANHPLNAMQDALEAFYEDGDVEAAAKKIEVQGRRAGFITVPKE